MPYWVLMNDWHNVHLQVVSHYVVGTIRSGKNLNSNTNRQEVLLHFSRRLCGPGPSGPVRINRYYWLFVILEGFYGKQKYR